MKEDVCKEPQAASTSDHYFILQLSYKVATLVVPTESHSRLPSAECYFFAGGLGPFVFGIESEVVTKEEGRQRRRHRPTMPPFNATAPRHATSS